MTFQACQSIAPQYTFFSENPESVFDSSFLPRSFEPPGSALVILVISQQKDLGIWVCQSGLYNHHVPDSMRGMKHSPNQASQCPPPAKMCKTWGPVGQTWYHPPLHSYSTQKFKKRGKKALKTTSLRSHVKLIKQLPTQVPTIDGQQEWLLFSRMGS